MVGTGLTIPVQIKLIITAGTQSLAFLPVCPVCVIDALVVEIGQQL